jgi:hypothetical protein
MSAGCVTEPLAERTGEIIAIPASVGYLAQRLARLYRRSTLDYARSLVHAQINCPVRGGGSSPHQDRLAFGNEQKEYTDITLAQM